MSAALAAPYIETFEEARKAPAEITFSTAACSLRWRCGRAAWIRNTGPRRFTSNDFCHASGVNWPSGWVSALAALLTTMSTPPKRSTVRSTSAWRASRSPMWVATPSAWPPRPTRWASVSAHASGLRLATTTLAPAAT